MDAVPGHCAGTNQSACYEDAVTNVTIYKYSCKEEWVGTDCIHAFAVGSGEDKEVHDCY